jgi:hypothetical protein
MPLVYAILCEQPAVAANLVTEYNASLDIPLDGVLFYLIGIQFTLQQLLQIGKSYLNCSKLPDSKAKYQGSAVMAHPLYTLPLERSESTTFWFS